jgi:hypothetical protein
MVAGTAPLGDCPRIDEDAVLRDFEAISDTLKGQGLPREGKVADATVVGGDVDGLIASVARSWSGSTVTQQAADEARREAHELLARWSLEAPRPAPSVTLPAPSSPPRPRPPPQPAAQPEQPQRDPVAAVAAAAAPPPVGAAAPRSASPTLSSSQSDTSAPSTASWAAAAPLPSGPDPVGLLESRRQADATILAQHRLQAAAEWQQRALWQQRELEQEQHVQATNEQRALEHQREMEHKEAERKSKARELRWARAKARAASALAKESAARAGREEAKWMVKATRVTKAVASARDRRLCEQAEADAAKAARRAKERARREEASRRWERSRRLAEEAAREQSLLQVREDFFPGN